MSNFITLDQAIALTGYYRTQKELILIPDLRDSAILPICETFDASAFSILLAQADCAAIRVYLGMNEKKEVRILAVGVNAAGEDLLPAENATAQPVAGSAAIVEDGQRCPTICHPSPLSGNA